MSTRENYEINIRTIKEKLPESSQIDMGEDFCLMDISYLERGFLRCLANNLLSQIIISTTVKFRHNFLIFNIFEK